MSAHPVGELPATSSCARVRANRWPPATRRCSAPTRFSAGTSTSVKNTSLKSRSLRSYTQRTAGASDPGVSVGISTALMPLCFGASGSVRTKAAAVGIVRARRPDLLPVDHEPLPVQHARVRRPREIGSGAGFAHARGTPSLGTQHRHRPSPLLLSVPNDSSDAAMMPTPCGLKRDRCAAGRAPRGGRTARGSPRHARRIRADCPAEASRGRTAAAANGVTIPVCATSTVTALPPRLGGRCLSRNAMNSARNASTSSSNRQLHTGPQTYQVLNICAACAMTDGCSTARRC